MSGLLRIVRTPSCNVATSLLLELGRQHTYISTAVLAEPKAAGDGQPPSQYLFQFESSDISRLRADVQSLGFVSLVRCAAGWDVGASAATRVSLASSG